MSDTCNFSIRHYREIVEAFIERGYRFVSFRDYAPSQDHQIILRHDIDIDLEDAVRLAKVDASLGVSASYHLLLTAETYNLMSAEGQSALQRIRQLGQNIGLHIDPSVLSDEPDAARADLADLFRLAASVLGDLDAYSLHRPATYGELDGLEREMGIALPPSADALRQNMIYRSDSRRVWRQGCVCQELDAFRGASIQLLMHPIWWTDQSLGRDETLARQVDAHQHRMDRYLSDNLSFYASRWPAGQAEETR